MKKQKSKKDTNYLDFLQKRLASKNYKTNVSSEEYNKTKAKYDKEKLKIKLLGSR